MRIPSLFTLASALAGPMPSDPVAGGVDLRAM
jgi:hypothetical protein